MLKLLRGVLQQKVEKEVRSNADLLARLERRKQVFHKWHMKLKQDVSRLQEQF